MLDPIKVAEWLKDNGYKSHLEVNSGGCERFAIAFQADVPNAELIGTDNTCGWDTEYPGHIWLFDGVMHYDSECLEGVHDWHGLPIFKRYLEKKKCSCN